MYLHVVIFLLTLFQPNLVQTELKNMLGKKQTLQHFENYDATVIWFISPECPLCQNYTLSIKKLKAKYGTKIRVIGMVSSKSYGIKEMKKFLEDYQIQLEIMFDEEKKLAQILGASITPEVFVFNNKSQLVYSGRIDNWAYAPGKKRSVITQHELANVIEKLVRHEEVKYFKTQAIGCFIE